MHTARDVDDNFATGILTKSRSRSEASRREREHDPMHSFGGEIPFGIRYVN